MMLIAQAIHRFPGLCGRFCVKVRHVICVVAGLLCRSA